MRQTGLAAFCVATALVLMPASPLDAHVKDEVAGGVELTLGWQAEPAFVGEPNAVQVVLRQGGRPVDAARAELRAEVIFGGADGEPRRPAVPLAGSGDPGELRSEPFVPTRPGTYTFRITGTVDGNQVDSTYTSGKAGEIGGTAFDDVREASAAAFPEADPTTRDLAAALERIEAAAKNAEDSAAGARTVGLVGIGAAILALVVAGLATVRSGRRTT